MINFILCYCNSRIFPCCSLIVNDFPMLMLTFFFLKLFIEAFFKKHSTFLLIPGLGGLIGFCVANSKYCIYCAKFKRVENKKKFLHNYKFFRKIIFIDLCNLKFSPQFNCSIYVTVCNEGWKFLKPYKLTKDIKSLYIKNIMALRPVYKKWIVPKGTLW